MAELSDPRIGTLLEGRYRLDQRLAAGGMGVVYKGELVAIGKPVAIKFLHDALAAIPDLVKRFQREATAMSRLAHPNIVSVIDSGLAGGVPYLVMDFVSGRSLADVLAAGPMPATRAAGLGRQILSGVKHAHGSHVVHRDLKPDNILLLDGVEGDFVKILDFGLAKVLRGEDSGGTQLTNTGFALGTPGYMSPEQARGVEADERTDLYSVGVILYHMVTGRKPFVADSPLAVLRMHMDDAPTPPTQLVPRCCSPELERVILRAMAKEPASRWATAAEFAQALAATPEGREAASGGDEGWTSPRRRGPSLGSVRTVAGLVARGAVLAALVTAGVFLWQHLGHRSQQTVKRELGDAVKIAQGAFQSAKEGAKELAKPLPPKKPDGTRPATKKPDGAKTSDAKPPEVKPPQPKPEEVKPPEVAKQEAAPPPPAPVVEKKQESPPPVADKKAETPLPTPPPVAPPTTAPADDEDDDDAVEEPAPPSDTPGAKLEQQMASAPEPSPIATPSAPKKEEAARGPSTKEARALLDAGKLDSAIRTLYAVRKKAHGSAEVALLLGHAYFRKLWRTDGLREYDNAIKLMPALRYNHLLVRNTVGALEEPTYRLARAVIKARIGPAALPEVKRAARTAKSPRLRARAARLAQQLAHSRRR